MSNKQTTIIFLDIDGVLNSDIWYKSQAKGAAQSNDLSLHLDEHAISLLNKIIVKTGAKVVISSTWRKYYTIDKIQLVLEAAGFVGNVIAFTPDLTSGRLFMVRGNEILAWCQANEAMLNAPYQNYHQYVILDDKDDMLFWQKDNFFRTDRYCGLTPTLASQVIKFLAR